MNKEHSPITRVIAVILIAAFFIQDIAFANPDLGRNAPEALQVPSRYGYLTTNNILQDTLQYILFLPRYKNREIKDLKFRLTPNLRKDVSLVIDFSMKYQEDEDANDWVVPCSVGYGDNPPWVCEAVIRPDKTFYLRSPGQKNGHPSVVAARPKEMDPPRKHTIQRIQVNDILKRSTGRENEISSALEGATLSAVTSCMRLLTLKSTYEDPEISVTMPEGARSALLAKALAVSLRRTDAKEVAGFLEDLIKESPAALLPEAVMFIRSYLAIFHIDRPVTLAVTISLYETQDKYPDKPGGHGWFSAKTEQFFTELLSVNPLVNGFFVFVNDGDDSAKYGRKTSDVLKGLLAAPKYDGVRDRVHILELSQEDREEMGSVKHGAIACGMRYAIDHGADVVFYTDSDLSAHLGLLGLLTDSIINKGNGLAFGSIEKAGAVAPGRPLKRSLGTLLYNLWVRAILKPIRGIYDTQRSFKGFAKNALEEILPVDILSVSPVGVLKIYFSHDFNYDFTGDTEWLGRARIAGYGLDEIPIVWVDMPETSYMRFGKHAFEMFKRVWRQRKNFGIFAKKPRHIEEQIIEHTDVDPAVYSGRLARRYERSPGLETIFFDSGNEISVEFDPATHAITREVVTDRITDKDGRSRILGMRIYGSGHMLEKAIWYDENEQICREETARDYQLFKGDAARWIDLNEYNTHELLRQAVGVRYLTPEVESDIKEFVQAIFDSDIPEFINGLRYDRSYPGLCGAVSQHIYETLRDRKISAELILNGAGGEGIHYVVKVNLGGAAFLIDGAASQFESIPRGKPEGLANINPPYLYRNTGLAIIPASVARNLPGVGSIYTDRKRGSLIARSFNAKTGKEFVVDIKTELARLSPKRTSKNIDTGGAYLGMNLFIPSRPDGGVDWAKLGASLRFALTIICSPFYIIRYIFNALRASSSPDPLDDLTAVKGLLYGPNLGSDLDAIRQLISKLPDINEYVLVDPGYKYGLFDVSNLFIHDVTLIGNEVEDGKLGEGGKVTLSLSYKGHKVTVHCYAEDPGTFNPPELKDKADVIVVRAPGRALEKDISWRAHLIGDQLKKGGWLLTQATKISSANAIIPLLGLERIKPYSHIFSLSFVLHLFGYDRAGGFNPYRKVQDVDLPEIERALCDGKPIRKMSKEEVIFDRALKRLVRAFEKKARNGKSIDIASVIQDLSILGEYVKKLIESEASLAPGAPEVNLANRILWLQLLILTIDHNRDKIRDNKAWAKEMSGLLRECYNEIHRMPPGRAKGLSGAETYRVASMFLKGVQTKHMYSMPALQSCLKKVMDHASLDGSSRCLEIGSGIGIMQDMAGDSVLLDMTDFNPFFCATNKAMHPNSNVTIHDARNLSCTDGSYDAVLELGVLDIADDLGSIVTEINRSLHDGGAFIHFMDLAVVPSVIEEKLNRWSRDLVGTDLLALEDGKDSGGSNFRYLKPAIFKIKKKIDEDGLCDYDRERLGLLLKAATTYNNDCNKLYEDILETEFHNRGFTIEFHDVVTGEAYVPRGHAYTPYEWMRDEHMEETLSSADGMSWTENGQPENPSYVVSFRSLSNILKPHIPQQNIHLAAGMHVMIARKIKNDSGQSALKDHHGDGSAILGMNLFIRPRPDGGIDWQATFAPITRLFFYLLTAVRYVLTTSIGLLRKWRAKLFESGPPTGVEEIFSPDRFPDKASSYVPAETSAGWFISIRERIGKNLQDQSLLARSEKEVLKDLVKYLDENPGLPVRTFRVVTSKGKDAAIYGFDGKGVILPGEFTDDFLPGDDQGTPSIPNPFRLQCKFIEELILRAILEARQAPPNTIHSLCERLFKENYFVHGPDRESILDYKMEVLKAKRNWLIDNPEMTRMVVYEFNTAMTINEISAKKERKATLADIPGYVDESSDGRGWFERIRDLFRVTAIWPMGVKSRDRIGEAIARVRGKQGGSPYALVSNKPDERWGGQAAYNKFAVEARRQDFALVGDWVSNHLGFGSEFVRSQRYRRLFIIRDAEDEVVRSHPDDWYVYRPNPENPEIDVPELYGRAILKARDWDNYLGTGDVAQISFHDPESWELLLELIEEAASQVCDKDGSGHGVLRFDLAHYLWRDSLYYRTREFLTDKERLQSYENYNGIEFWEFAIPRLKKKFPKLTCIAEVYGGPISESYLLALGFDVAYDKEGGIYEFLVDRRDPEELNVHLRRLGIYARSGLYFMGFLENHDEPSARYRFYDRTAHAAALFIARISRMPWLMYAGEERGIYDPKHDAEDAHPKYENAPYHDLWRSKLYGHPFLRHPALTNGRRIPMAVLNGKSEGTIASYLVEHEGKFYIGAANIGNAPAWGTVQIPLSRMMGANAAKMSFILRDRAHQFFKGSQSGNFDEQEDEEPSYIRTFDELNNLTLNLRPNEFQFFEIIPTSNTPDMERKKRAIKLGAVPYCWISGQGSRGVNPRSLWWRDPTRIHVAASVPIYGLRIEGKMDSGIGKYTYIAPYAKKELLPYGIDTVLLLPFFANLTGAPYEVASSWALQEAYIDWTEVDEVRGDKSLLGKLTAPEKAQRHVDQSVVEERERPVALEAYDRFLRSRRRVALFKRFMDEDVQRKKKLEEYSEFMALHEILGRSSLEWSRGEAEKAMQNPRFAVLKGFHLYSQWVADIQLKKAVSDIHKLDGKVGADMPGFRAKDGPDVYFNRYVFRDVENPEVYPGVVKPGDPPVNERWRSLALWNYTGLASDGFSFIIRPIRNLLDRYGFDFMRLDAFNFFYPFWGQLFMSDDNPHPGDNIINTVKGVFDVNGAMPVAEAMDGVDEKIRVLGVPVVRHKWENPARTEGWWELSNHDYPLQEATQYSFMGEFLKRLNKARYASTMSRVINVNLYDLWGDTRSMKRTEGNNGKTFWDTRIPMSGDPDYKDRVRYDVRPLIAREIGIGRVDGGRWPWLQKSLYDKSEAFLKSYLPERVARFIGQAFVPAVVESGLFVGCGTLLLNLWAGWLFQSHAPPLLVYFILTKMIWHRLHGPRDKINLGAIRLITILDLLSYFILYPLAAINGAIFIIPFIICLVGIHSYIDAHYYPDNPAKEKTTIPDLKSFEEYFPGTRQEGHHVMVSGIDSYQYFTEDIAAFLKYIDPVFYARFRASLLRDFVVQRNGLYEIRKQDDWYSVSANLHYQLSLRASGLPPRRPSAGDMPVLDPVDAEVLSRYAGLFFSAVMSGKPIINITASDGVSDLALKLDGPPSEKRSRPLVAAGIAISAALLSLLLPLDMSLESRYAVTALIGHWAASFVDHDKKWSRYFVGVIAALYSASQIGWYVPYIKDSLPDFPLYKVPLDQFPVSLLTQMIPMFILIGIREIWKGESIALRIRFLRENLPNYIKAKVSQLFAKDGYFQFIVLAWAPIVFFNYDIVPTLDGALAAVVAMSVLLAPYGAWFSVRKTSEDGSHPERRPWYAKVLLKHPYIPTGVLSLVLLSHFGVSSQGLFAYSIAASEMALLVTMYMVFFRYIMPSMVSWLGGPMSKAVDIASKPIFRTGHSGGIVVEPLPANEPANPSTVVKADPPMPSPSDLSTGGFVLSSKDPVGYFSDMDIIVRDLSKPDELALNLAEFLASLSLNKEIVLAFDDQIGRGQAGGALSIFGELERIKKETGLLKNLTIVHDQPDGLGEKLENYIKAGVPVFTFALAQNRPVLTSVESSTLMTYIDETRFPPSAYYPLAQIVAIRLAHYMKSSILEEILRDRSKLNTFNIKDIVQDPDSAAIFIFTLLPEAKELSTFELMKQYAAIKQFLRAA